MRWAFITFLVFQDVEYIWESSECDIQTAGFPTGLWDPNFDAMAQEAVAVVFTTQNR